MSRWNGDPVLLVTLAVSALAMTRLPDARRIAGLAGIAVLFVAFVSPLCALTTALFSARAVHHLLLVTVAAPLLAVALQPRRAIGMAITIALPLSTAILWGWHAPALYDAALGHVGIYWIMQATLLASGWLFWAAVLHARPAEAAAGIIGGAVQMGFLGALLTFAGRPLYAAHLSTTVAFGIGPLADQQLAGLVMWVPGMAPYAAAAAWIATRRWRAIALNGPANGAAA
ncbi:cytochrome c oxidase assembly protein [Sphingomonas faeni]|uniref:cytochrome c oxidase assembly protein n=1 Tax=Sphingomonas faeni TaxID=185950 RepID=UPI0027839216|nr:cytochrome c oxidase assembly protein [Sphingomonas faeni]MDQ0836536.1 putative membrane protein [Sphingomonas faeni]